MVQTRLGSDREPDLVETKLQIMEMECYFWNSTCHGTHSLTESRSKGQQVNGRKPLFSIIIYLRTDMSLFRNFHRTPRRSGDSTQTLISTSGYRGGTRKGLDLTISGVTPTKSPYFPSSSQPDGERRIRRRAFTHSSRLETRKNYLRSILLVDHILLLSGAERISDLVQDHWKMTLTRSKVRM